MPVIHAGRLALLAALIIASPLGGAQTATATTTSQPATATAPDSKLTAQFTELAGSKENAASLVNGLRTGSAITLTSQPAPGTPPAAGGTTFTSPTKPMGYGNVRIALSLAKAQLASQGIANPTPDQLQAALVGAPGGTTTGTTQPGILQMRADGMGWGKIANTMGVKLGAVMSGKQTWPAAGTTTTATSSGVTTAAGGTGKSSGITTAGGSSGGKHSGITTAGGGQGRSGVTTGLGQGHSSGMAYGHAARGGVVTAAGGHAGSMAGGGNGQGHGSGKH